MNQENTEEQSPEILLKRSRGAQLRALVLAWATNETYQRVLQEQAKELHSGELEINDDWGEIANSILDQFSGAQDD